MTVSNIYFNNNALTTIPPPTSALINCPEEIIALICNYLSSRDTVQLVLANRTFCFLTSSSPIAPPLWNLFLSKDFSNSYTAPKSKIKNFALYKSLKNAVRNMKVGKYRPQILNGDQNGIAYMTIRDGKLIAGSWDPTIKIWDLSTGQGLQTQILSGDQDSITCMTVLDNMLISGSWDPTIKIWDLSTGQLLQALHGHQDSISYMTVLDGKLISCSWDHTIKIWDLSTGQALQTLRGHQNSITCMTILDDKLICGSIDGKIQIWNLSSGQGPRLLGGHQKAITCMTILNGKLISASGDGIIKTWDPNTGQELQTLSGHHKITCMKILDGKLISGSKSGTIQIWNLSTGQVLQTLHWDQNSISHMEFLDGKLIVGSENGTIKIWDFNFPSLSSHSKEVLELNLKILGQMAHAEDMDQPEVVKELTENLHPDFKQRLKQHSYKTKSSSSCSKVVILRVQTEVCVETLLAAIYDQDDQRVSKLLNQLIWIDPQNNKIYELLWQICGKPNFDKWGEYAFHNKQRCSASSLQKEQAVVAFKQTLKDRWGEDLSLLLAHFGIVTKEEYSQKLNCEPDDLPAKGICSAADLQALYLKAGLSNSPAFQYLQIASEEAPKSLIQVEVAAFEKKDIVSTLLDKLFDAAQKKLEEIKPYSVITDENGKVYDANPWIAFLEKLKNAQADLNVEGLTRRQFAEKFSPEAYAELVKKANALIDEFRVVERKTQMMILHAYLNQWGIFKKWEEDLRGINGLSALLKTDKAPQDIFRMGK